MNTRKWNVIYNVSLAIFSVAVFVLKKYSDGNGLNIVVILSICSLIAFFFSFVFFIPVYNWNKCLRDRSIIEEFMEDNLDYKTYEKISKQERFDKLIGYVGYIFAINNVSITRDELIILINEEKIDQVIEEKIIKQKKYIKKAINEYNDDVSEFTKIKMSYKSGYYSTNQTYSIFWTLFSISISLFGVSSIEAFKYYDKYDITFVAIFSIISIITFIYDLKNGLFKMKESLRYTYDYLIQLKEKSLKDESMKSE